MLNVLIILQLYYIWYIIISLEVIVILNISKPFHFFL